MSGGGSPFLLDVKVPPYPGFSLQLRHNLSIEATIYPYNWGTATEIMVSQQALQKEARKVCWQYAVSTFDEGTL